MAYRFVPRTIRLLKTYWGRLTIVVRADGYFGVPFKVYRGVTQGDPLPPTISNVVVDAVIRYWVVVVAPTEDGTEALGLSIQNLAAYFYAKDFLVVLNQPDRLHWAFDVLVGLFGWVGIRTNARKMVSMACQPCHTPGQI